MTREEGEAALRDELSEKRAAVIRHAKKNNYDFTDNELDALTSFAYNIGSIDQPCFPKIIYKIANGDSLLF